MSGLYIYGIVRSQGEEQLGEIGMGDPPTKVSLISHADLAVAVSQTNTQIYIPDPKAILQHERVVQHLMEKFFTVLPMRFGTVAGSRKEAIQFLEMSRASIFEALSRLTGRVEGGLKTFWNREAVIAEVQTKTGNTPNNSLAGSKKAYEYQKAIEVGQLVQEIVENWREELLSQVKTQLGSLYEEIRINDPIGVKMLLNCAFLLKRDRQEVFEKQLDELSEQYRGRVNFKYVSPLPPYNFVNIQLSGGLK